jgi:hypothetical protein
MSLPNVNATDAKLGMVGWRYQLSKPCPAVSTFGKLHENIVRTLVIPKDELITVTDGPFNGARLVDIEWDAKPYMMFTEHLRDCGRRLGITSS